MLLLPGAAGSSGQRFTKSVRVRTRNTTFCRCAHQETPHGSGGPGRSGLPHRKRSLTRRRDRRAVCPGARIDLDHCPKLQALTGAEAGYDQMMTGKNGPHHRVTTYW
jgi:hypothetical protein